MVAFSATHKASSTALTGPFSFFFDIAADNDKCAGMLVYGYKEVVLFRFSTGSGQPEKRATPDNPAYSKKRRSATNWTMQIERILRIVICATFSSKVTTHCDKY